MTTQKNDTVVIPKKELKKLEDARVLLWDLATKYNFSSVLMYELEQVTSVMFKLANTNWDSDV